MADGTITLSTLAPLLAIPDAMFVGERAADARLIAIAQMKVHLRGLLVKDASRSSHRLNPLHEALACVLAGMEISHQEVEQATAFAKHDGAALSSIGPLKLNDLLSKKCEQMKSEPLSDLFDPEGLMCLIVEASAMARFLDGSMDEHGCLQIQRGESRARVFPTEVEPTKEMAVKADVTVLAVNPQDISLSGSKKLHMSLSWLGATILLSECGEQWAEYLVGTWTGGAFSVEITSNGEALSIKLIKGNPGNILGVSLKKAQSIYEMRFFEGAASKVSAKAASSSMGGNTGTTTRSMHSEGDCGDVIAMIHAIPLLSANGRKAKVVGAENPKGSTLKALKSAITSEQKSIRDGREVPLGIQYGALIVTGPSGPDLPWVVFHKHQSTLNRLAGATLLELISLELPLNDLTAPFRSLLRSMITSLTHNLCTELVSQWGTLHWVGIGANTPNGIPLGRECIDQFLYDISRERSPARLAVLSDAGCNQDPPSKLPPVLPASLQKTEKAVRKVLDEQAKLSVGRSTVQALARLSEMSHKLRKETSYRQYS